MKLYKSNYRILKTSWGIAIDISGGYLPILNQQDLNGYTKICDGLWGICTDEIGINEQFLWSGLEKVSYDILDKTPYNNTLIVITNLVFNNCDFQVEGLTAAIIKWASNCFGFIMPDINVTYSKDKNKYEFNF